MGREIKRVSLDFEWPLHKVWEGFINPYYKVKDCPKCEGKGLAPQALTLFKQWYGYVDFDPASTGSVPYDETHPIILERARRNYSNNPTAVIFEARRLADHFNSWQHHLNQEDVDALIAKDRLWDFTRNGNLHPTAKEVNEWSIDFGFGHDGLNEYICLKAKCERLGYPMKCEHCNGEGHLWLSEELRQQYEAWQETEPPSGEGWQLWETTSEGSPISPVFPDEQSFISYLVQQGYSEHAATEFCKTGHAFSLLIVNGVLYRDIESFDAK